MIVAGPEAGRFTREDGLQVDRQYAGTATSERKSLPFEDAIRVGAGGGDEPSRPGFIRNGRGSNDDEEDTIVTKLAAAGARGLFGDQDV